MLLTLLPTTSCMLCRISCQMRRERSLHHIPLMFPGTAMQEALHAGALEQSQDQQHGVCVPRLQQAAHLEEARDKDSGLVPQQWGTRRPNGSLGPRRVSFNVGSKEADGPNSGCSMVLADSQSRAISLSELREVMRKMKFTRCFTHSDACLPQCQRHFSSCGGWSCELD